MLHTSVNILDELDNLSNVHSLERDEIDQIMVDFGQRILKVMKIERMSVWLLNDSASAIVSMGEYDNRTNQFTKGNTLLKKNYPAYFKAISENKILLIDDVVTNSITKEFAEDYSKPNNIVSLMDIPLRIEGEVVGVMCFEKVGVQKVFDEKEQTFAFGIATVFSSNLEARVRRSIQHKLKAALEEKEMLIQEINHRVKNNFSILIGLLRISKQKNNHADQIEIFEEFEQRIFSMLKIHELLYKTKNYTSISLSAYLKELAGEFKSSHPDLNSCLVLEIDDVDCSLPTKQAIHVGLIVTEIFINSIKYGHAEGRDYQFKISLKQIDNNIQLLIGDNGNGFDFEVALTKDTLGVNLIKDLADDVDIKGIYPSIHHKDYEFLF